jgi:hypothetical protein
VLLLPPVSSGEAKHQPPGSDAKPPKQVKLSGGRQSLLKQGMSRFSKPKAKKAA